MLGILYQHTTSANLHKSVFLMYAYVTTAVLLKNAKIHILNFHWSVILVIRSIINGITRSTNKKILIENLEAMMK